MMQGRTTDSASASSKNLHGPHFSTGTETPTPNQAPDPKVPGMSEAVEKARERVRQIALEIESLAHGETEEGTFFNEFLAKITSAMGAVGAFVWWKQGSTMVPAFEIGVDKVGYRRNPQADSLNQPILSDILRTGRSLLTGDGESPPRATPTPHLLVLCPLQRGKEIVGIIQVFQRTGTPIPARPGFLQFVEQMSGTASRYLELRQKHAERTDPAETLKQLRQFAIDLQRTLDVTHVSATAANDGRQLIGCDRVGIAVRRGNRMALRALSGQDSVNRSANLVRLMETLINRVAATGEPLSYTGSLEQMAPQVEKALADYVQDGGSRCVLCVPLHPPKKKEQKSTGEIDAKKKTVRPNPIGVMIVEQVTESRPSPEMLQRVEFVADYTAAALSNARRHEGLFLMPVWRTLGGVAENFRGRRLLTTVGLMLAVVAVTLGLILIPKAYWVEARGKIMPTVRQQVFAPAEGIVDEILVQSGDWVEEGTPLVLLVNDELQARLNAARSAMEERKKMRQALMQEQEATTRTATSAERARIRGRIAQVDVEIQGTIAQIRILERQLEELVVKAPIKGQVATFQLEEILTNRPVSRGELLIELMDIRQDWRLELDLPEYRLGHVLEEQSKQDKEELSIEFMLATRNDSKYEAKLSRVSERSVVAEEQGNVIELVAELSPETLREIGAELRPGAEVRAHIQCGEKSLGYFLLGDIKEFFLTRWWF